MQKKVNKQRWNITVSVSLPEGVSQRVDVYIMQTEHFESRSLFKRQCKEIWINDHQAKLSNLVRNTDTLRIYLELENPPVLQAEDIPLDILYEDENVLFVNKASGMLVHPGKGNQQGTLANACLKYLHPDGWEEYENKERLGIVHRLDADTSGVIVLAKNEAVHAWLSRAFSSRKVEKEYRAIVKGRVQAHEQEIKTYIKRDPWSKTRFIADLSDGKESVTRLTRLHVTPYKDRFYTYVALFPKTGRTHQLRVHMQYRGHPILGDAKYARRDAVFPKAQLHLHALRLRLLRYRSTEYYDVTAPLPLHFRDTLQQLRML